MTASATMIAARWRYGLFAALTMALMTPAILAPPMTHDSFWIDSAWAEQFTALLRSGNLYPRWLPWSYGGLGSPAFYFYAPLSFHLTGLFGLAGLPTYASLLAAFAIAWFASGVSMYTWLKPSAPAPLVGALLYMVLPYHVMDFYGRGALAEFCAFALVPLVAMGVLKAAETHRASLLACAYAALILTHLPTALVISVLLIGPYSLWLARKSRQSLLAIARGVATGIAAAAIYLIPALTLQRYSSVGALWSVKFLRPVSWSVVHPELWTSPSYVFLFSGLALGVAIAVAVLMRKNWSFWAVWTVAICFIVAGLLPGFWSLPIMSAVQFPWRALVLAEFGLATLAASHRNSPVILAAAVAPLLFISLLMATPANPMHGEPMVPLPIPGRQDVIEYLPVGAVGPERAPKLDLLRQAAADARANPGSSFPFPSVQARCGIRPPTPLAPAEANALIVVPPAGCRVSVERLPVERLGLAISLLAWLTLAIAGARRTALPSLRRRLLQ